MKSIDTRRLLGLVLMGIGKTPTGALWQIGNEMDVIWQDNNIPEQYVAALVLV